MPMPSVAPIQTSLPNAAIAVGVTGTLPAPAKLPVRSSASRPVLETGVQVDPEKDSRISGTGVALPVTDSSAQPAPGPVSDAAVSVTVSPRVWYAAGTEALGADHVPRVSRPY